MIDSNFHVYLIEANTNPCLEILSPITARIVPSLLDNIFRYTIDPIFQPPEDFYSTKKCFTNDIFPELKFELIFDSSLEKSSQNINSESKENKIGFIKS